MSKELLDLMHRIRVSKYHKSNPRHVLMHMVEEVRRKKHYGNFRCWELMVEHLARWLVLNKQTGLACMPPLQGFKGLNLEKNEVFKHLESLDLFRHYVTAAKGKPWDYIGDIYMTDLELCQAGQNMTPRAIVEMMTQMVYATESEEKMLAEFYCFESYREYVARYYQTHHVPPTHLRPMKLPMKTQLDPCVGTGRFLMVASQMMPKAPLVLFGIEINLALYRACLVNMAMFSNHPYSIICADALRLGLVGSASRVWDLGNRWNPPDLSAYYWKPPPIRADHFSLKAFTEKTR